MRALHERREQGSIVMALLALLVLTGIVTAGLATVVGSHLAARHDVAFESALAEAESGLDELVAQVQADPSRASFDPLHGGSGGTTYTATATSAGAGSWTVDSYGTGSLGTRSVTRHIQATVSVGTVPPLFGDTAVTLSGGSSPAGSAIDRYDSSVSSAVCQSNGTTPTTMLTANTRMCQETTPAVGGLATNGALTMRSADLSNISEADIYSAPLSGYTDPGATGKCNGDGGVCGSSSVVTHTDKASFPAATLCANGIGGGTTAYDGSNALAANAVYSFNDVTLNATAVANLANISGSQIIICFNHSLTIPSLLPINAALDGSPRAPSTLLLIGTGDTTPTINFGGQAAQETSISAVIYAPNATCQSNGHVDVYGLLVCGSVASPNGLDVHYDTQVGSLSFDRPVTVTHWHEITSG